MRQGDRNCRATRKAGTYLACLALLGLPGCMSGTEGAGVSRMLMPDASPVAEGLDPGDAGQDAAEASALLNDLMGRRSALPDGSVLADVADAVLAADSRPAGAALRSARLRARAQSRNWLPSIGPQVSLSSLGSVVAMLVVEQVIFDNGRKKAERDFAKADVEVAAVTLVQDSNARVRSALTLYLAAREAQDKAALAHAAERDMSQFEWIMSERVAGGISDQSDLQVLRQKLAEIRATQQREGEAARAAVAELSAMGVDPAMLEGDALTRGSLEALRLPDPVPVPLPVRMAEAEQERAMARARIERAGFLPTFSANAAVGRGAPDPSLDLRTARPLGFGTADDLRAVEAATEGERRKVVPTREDSERRLRRLQQERIALARQAQEGMVLTSKAKANLDLFQAQYDAGQRQVMDVVGLYEQFARQQQQAAGLAYRAMQAELDIAAELGLLADGGKL